MQNPYEVLGVGKNATEGEIRTAYRRLAKKHHPDLNPGNAQAEARFKEVSAANDLLSDSDKRARFDRGEIDASGAEKPPERPFYRDFGDSAGRTKYRPEQQFDPENFEDIFSQAFGGRTRRGADARGQDVQYSLEVGFLEAANGASRRLSLPDGRTLDVTIPAGLRDGQILRLKGQGAPSFGDGPAGDALITIMVSPHPLFRLEGNDVVVTVPLTLKEAVLGDKIAVPTIKGPVNLAIPPNASSGMRLRLKGRGLADGHQYVELKIVLPSETEPELAAFLNNWVPQHPFDPRKGMVE